jgi:hypothetical protein
MYGRIMNTSMPTRKPFSVEFQVLKDIMKVSIITGLIPMAGKQKFVLVGFFLLQVYMPINIFILS